MGVQTGGPKWGSILGVHIALGLAVQNGGPKFNGEAF
jgi:hypothetical protein